ncbi:MAG: inorganic phosphate transporter [Simkania sp.]|nr:inorganic phosphate transporter [Simkania sp.]
MEVESILKIIVLVVGFYMAWNIGANDVSNAMGTSVGSGALTIKRAVFLAAIFEFSGAFFVGANVSETMQKGLIDTSLFLSDPTLLIIGMCGALLGTSIWLQIASYFGWPVSTTHAIVGSILGFGALVGGLDAVQWEETLSIALSWVVSPVISGIIAYLIFNTLQRNILFAMSPVDATRRFMPILMAIVSGTFTLSLIFNGLKNLDLFLSFPAAIGIALLVAALGALLTYLYFHKFRPKHDTCNISTPSPHALISLHKAIKHLQRVQVSTYNDVHEQISKVLNQVRTVSSNLQQESGFISRTSDYQIVEKMFVWLQVLSASFVAFAHGANDVANAIGPVAAVLDIIKQGTIMETSVVPVWLLAFGGVGIVIGLATWGWRVIETVGKKITELTPTRGFCAEFGAATTILIASKLGLPISTTHCLVGAVLGVGLARGIHAINLNILKEIVLSWIITLPTSALMSILFYYILKGIFL